jgi:hypothetical protein
MEAAKQSGKHDERLLRYALAAGVVLALICLYYLEENWRGRHNWNQLKQRLEANGGRVDWTNYIPAPVPDDGNFFAVPKMQRWFTGRGGNDLTARIDSARNDFLDRSNREASATVTVVKRGEKIPVGTADVLLDYDADLGAFAFASETTFGGAPDEAIPMIALKDVPLSDAIKCLAQQAVLAYTLDPKVTRHKPEREVSFKWTNLTGKAALGAVLKNYGLQFVPDSQTGVGRIVPKNSSYNDPVAEAAVTNRMEELLVKSLGEVTNRFQGKCAYTAMGILLTADSPGEIKPVRVVVRTDGTLSASDLSAIFPSLKNERYPNLNSRAHVESAGSNSFAGRMEPIAFMRAADYLKWSDSLAPEFNLIRESLKRPYAQMTGNYTDPINIPIPNFICQRIIAQTLTDRAKCHLLLGQPEAALDDLALVRGLCRIMEGGPDGRPTTLVATMINSAVTALYDETIAEGMRLGAWREPQLAALQEQLKQINLPPLLAESFQWERASVCKTLEGVTAERLQNMFKGGPGGPAKPLWDKMKDPTYLLLTVGPRGWVYQNMTRIALLDDQVLKGLDTKNRLVSSPLTEKATSNTLAELDHFSPYTYLAAFMIPNFTSAVRWLARSQCLTDEALIACALERYRIAHGEYPQSLATLAPQFLEKIPADIITGRPLKYRLKKDGQFLLYSVGWNEKDDGGVPGATKWGIPDPAQGDWVWGVRPQ